VFLWDDEMLRRELEEVIYTLPFQRWSAIRRIKEQTFNRGIIRRTPWELMLRCVCDKPSVEAENFLKSVSQTTFYE
jgi:hypothetical protein